nr:ribonuclease H-like domain-containing protein [Tanacetum cinerariifolium]
MNPNNDMSDFYDYYTQLDMDRYAQYHEYFEQYESLEGDEGESSVGNSKRISRRYIPREREVAEEKLQRVYFGDEITPPIYPEEYFRRRIERLTNELEELKKEKEGLDSKLIVYSPPKKDMSWTGLPKFADDTINDYSRLSPSIEIVRTQFRVPRVPTVTKKFPTGNSKFSTTDLGNKRKAVKASACWIWRPKQNSTDKGPNSNRVSVIFKKYQYIDTQGRLKSDSGCSRHMTGNISYLSDYEPYDGGYVSFGQGGGKITGKGIIKTGKLYFKLKDDNNVLLRTPRQHNMYSVDLNNIVPHKDLTCLVAKASTDESMLWHRKLENLKEPKVKIIRCDNGGEFRNKEMNDFCSRKGIKREFSNVRTPQQNGVAERRNKALIEAVRTMLADAKLLVTFWAEAVNTACYVQNRVL